MSCKKRLVPSPQPDWISLSFVIQIYTSPITQVVLPPPPPPPILHNLCFLFLLGIAVLPKKNGRQCFCKWLGGKQNVLWEMCKCWSEKNSRDWVTGRAMVEVPVFTFFLWNLASYWMKTNGTALSFDANCSSFSFAKSPSRDLQITANKKLSAHAQCHWTVFGSK